ncbi:hypothetical protein C8R44DRAFT_889232 [Mycena epipterygia]|nr:hypothetical protein C8R44DRAFT_889232 [Mycena epipterygia]
MVSEYTSWMSTVFGAAVLFSTLFIYCTRSQKSALQHHVVAMHGADARKAFFNNKDLNLSDGYRLLVGGGPKVKDINANAGEYGRQFFLKNLLD